MEEKTSKLDTIKDLIEQGADINVEVDLFGRTPLIIAIGKAISEKKLKNDKIYSEYLKIIKLLIEKKQIQKKLCH